MHFKSQENGLAVNTSKCTLAVYLRVKAYVMVNLMAHRATRPYLLEANMGSLVLPSLSSLNDTAYNI